MTDEKFFELGEEEQSLRAVDNALVTWGEEQLGWAPVRGYASRDSSCADARSSVQWQTSSEVLEERVRGTIVRAVDGAMDSLVDPLERAVLWVVYANRVGPAVWRNGRFKDWPREKVRELHRKALRSLLPLLRRRGVVE